MAKCGHDICPDTSCGWRFPFNGGKRGECNRIKGCFEANCSSLKAYGPSGFALYDVCLGHCHQVASNPKYPANYPTTTDYLCDNFDPVSLVDYFGVNPCGVPEGQTKTGQAQLKESNTNVQIILALLAMAAVAGALLWYIFKK